MRFTFSKIRITLSFRAAVLQRMAKKCTKIQNARAEPLFYSLNPFFGGVLVGVTANYYTTRSASGQDEPNPALWLATQAGKMELSCLLGIRVMSRKEHLSCYGVLSRIINSLLTKLFRSKWLDIGLVLFFACLRTSTSSRSINTQKKNLANSQPSWPHAWSITHISWERKQGRVYRYKNFRAGKWKKDASTSRPLVNCQMHCTAEEGCF